MEQPLCLKKESTIKLQPGLNKRQKVAASMEEPSNGSPMMLVLQPVATTSTQVRKVDVTESSRQSLKESDKISATNPPGNLLTTELVQADNSVNLSKNFIIPSKKSSNPVSQRTMKQSRESTTLPGDLCNGKQSRSLKRQAETFIDHLIRMEINGEGKQGVDDNSNGKTNVQQMSNLKDSRKKSAAKKSKTDNFNGTESLTTRKDAGAKVPVSRSKNTYLAEFQRFGASHASGVVVEASSESSKYVVEESGPLNLVIRKQKLEVKKENVSQGYRTDDESNDYDGGKEMLPLEVKKENVSHGYGDECNDYDGGKETMSLEIKKENVSHGYRTDDEGNDHDGGKERLSLEEKKENVSHGYGDEDNGYDGGKEILSLASKIAANHDYPTTSRGAIDTDAIKTSNLSQRVIQTSEYASDNRPPSPIPSLARAREVKTDAKTRKPSKNTEKSIPEIVTLQDYIMSKFRKIAKKVPPSDEIPSSNEKVDHPNANTKDTFDFADDEADEKTSSSNSINVKMPSYSANESVVIHAKLSQSQHTVDSPVTQIMSKFRKIAKKPVPSSDEIPSSNVKVDDSKADIKDTFDFADDESDEETSSSDSINVKMPSYSAKESAAKQSHSQLQHTVDSADDETSPSDLIDVKMPSYSANKSAAKQSQLQHTIDSSESDDKTDEETSPSNSIDVTMPSYSANESAEIHAKHSQLQHTIDSSDDKTGEETLSPDSINVKMPSYYANESAEIHAKHPQLQHPSDKSECKITDNKSTNDVTTFVPTPSGKLITRKNQILIHEAVSEFHKLVEDAMVQGDAISRLEGVKETSGHGENDDDSDIDEMKYTSIIKDGKGKVLYNCNKCKVAFPHMTDLQMHTFTHFRRKHRCPACGKEFYNLSSVKRHMIIHTRLKPFKCPRCNRAFNLYTNLRKHFQRMHGATLPAFSRGTITNVKDGQQSTDNNNNGHTHNAVVDMNRGPVDKTGWNQLSPPPVTLPSGGQNVVDTVSQMRFQTANFGLPPHVPQTIQSTERNANFLSDPKSSFSIPAHAIQRQINADKIVDTNSSRRGPPTSPNQPQRLLATPNLSPDDLHKLLVMAQYSSSETDVHGLQVPGADQSIALNGRRLQPACSGHLPQPSPRSGDTPVHRGGDCQCLDCPHSIYANTLRAPQQEINMHEPPGDRLSALKQSPTPAGQFPLRTIQDTHPTATVPSMRWTNCNGRGQANMVATPVNKTISGRLTDLRTESFPQEGQRGRLGASAEASLFQTRVPPRRTPPEPDVSRITPHLPAGLQAQLPILNPSQIDLQALQKYISLLNQYKESILSSTSVHTQSNPNVSQPGIASNMSNFNSMSQIQPSTHMIRRHSTDALNINSTIPSQPGTQLFQRHSTDSLNTNSASQSQPSTQILQRHSTDALNINSTIPTQPATQIFQRHSTNSVNRNPMNPTQPSTQMIQRHGKDALNINSTIPTQPSTQFFQRHSTDSVNMNSTSPTQPSTRMFQRHSTDSVNMNSMSPTQPSTRMFQRHSTDSVKMNSMSPTQPSTQMFQRHSTNSVNINSMIQPRSSTQMLQRHSTDSAKYQRQPTELEHLQRMFEMQKQMTPVASHNAPLDLSRK
ncbi:uncharacterized protein [Amphiura filiformis]|uniref:uncharacterized protein n=1 Tax=Amphiura filiformis TaxID=82378 RepID=UPI003B21D6CF